MILLLGKSCWGYLVELKVLSSCLFPPQVVSFGWTVLLLPFQCGQEAPSWDHPVVSYWEARGSSGKQQVTAVKNCHLSASLVCIRLELPPKNDKKWNCCYKWRPCVCSADAGRSIVCGYSNTTLQCGSGQVIVIDGGFYGRKNIYHCRSGQSWVATPTRAQCGWVDVTQSLTGTKKAGSRISLKCNPHLFGCDAAAQLRGAECGTGNILDIWTCGALLSSFDLLKPWQNKHFEPYKKVLRGWVLWWNSTSLWRRAGHKRTIVSHNIYQRSHYRRETTEF